MNIFRTFFNWITGTSPEPVISAHLRAAEERVERRKAYHQAIQPVSTKTAITQPVRGASHYNDTSPTSRSNNWSNTALDPLNPLNPIYMSTVPGYSSGSTHKHTEDSGSSYSHSPSYDSGSSSSYDSSSSSYDSSSSSSSSDSGGSCSCD